MKKNVMMRIAAVLLVCVLVTTCGISGTFAKYTTKNTGTDTARVAKFGVTVEAISANSNTLFVDEYKNVQTEVVVDAAADAVAPGASGTMSDFTISGTPEVAVTVKYDATVTLAGWNITVNQTEEFYFPLTITVNDTPVNLNNCNDAADVKAAIEAAIEAISATYAVNSTIDSTLVVKWSWTFHTDAATDAKDTLLAAESAYTNNTITIAVDCIVEQANDLPDSQP